MFIFRRNFIPSLLRLQSSKVDETLQQNTVPDPDKQHCDKLDADDIIDPLHKQTSGKIGPPHNFNKLLSVLIRSSTFALIVLETPEESTTPPEQTDEDDSEDTDSNATASCDPNMVDSSLPPIDRKQQRLSELQKLKANCKSEDLEKLKTKCEILVRDCIAGLLVQLSDADFRSMEGNVFVELSSRA